jgi:hypothetical protein
MLPRDTADGWMRPVMSAKHGAFHAPRLGSQNSLSSAAARSIERRVDFQFMRTQTWTRGREVVSARPVVRVPAPPNQRIQRIFTRYGQADNRHFVRSLT